MAAQAFGISIAQHLIAAFVISSAVLAIAGGLQAPRSRIIDPESYGILASIATLAYPIVGGMSSVWGGLLGGTTLRLLPELLRPVADYQELLFAGLVLLTVLFFPGGMAGQLARLRRAKPAEAVGQGQPGRAPVPPTPAPAQADKSALLHVGNVSKSFDALRAVAWYLPPLWLLAPFLYVPGIPYVGRKVYAHIAEQRTRCTHEQCGF